MQLTPEQIKKEIELGKILNRIDELKRNLTNTDYKAIKFAENEISAEEYAETKAKRKAWRDEINRLEEEIK